MKSQFLLKASVILLTFFTLVSFTSKPFFNDSEPLYFQEEQLINAVYDGHEEYGYNFLAKNKDGEEYTITFHEISEELLKEFNLKSETLIGKNFTITYKTRVEVTKDDDGYDDEEEINTIIKLKKN